MNGYSRVSMTANVGKVGTVTDSTPTQSVQVQVSALETRDNVAILYAYGFTSNPHPGADVAMSCVEGDRTKAFAIATGDQRYRMRNLARGEVAIHDDLGRSVYLTRNGIVINGGGSPISIANMGTLSVAGDISCTGTIDAAGDVLAGTVSLLNHLTTGVQVGNGTSGPPEAGT